MLLLIMTVRITAFICFGCCITYGKQRSRCFCLIVRPGSPASPIHFDTTLDEELDKVMENDEVKQRILKVGIRRRFSNSVPVTHEVGVLSCRALILVIIWLKLKKSW
jgi:hypothetical protein